MFQPSGAYVSADFAAGGVGTTAGFELEVGGHGLFLWHVVPQALNQYGMTISDTSFLDTGVTPISPLFVFGPSPFLTTVVRRGYDSAGDVPGSGHYLFNAGTGNNPFGTHQHYAHPLFVPAGKFVTVRRQTTNAAFNCTIGFAEALR